MLKPSPEGEGFDPTRSGTIKISYRPYICPFSDLLKRIPTKSTIFDIGCGNGMFLSLLAKFNAPHAIGGIEISKELINNAQIAISNITPNTTAVSLDVFDGVNFPKEISSYSYVTLIDVLHHVPKSRQVDFLEEIYRVMSPNSIFIIKDIDGERRILSMFNKLHDLLFAGEAGNEIGATKVKRELNDIGFMTEPISYRRMFTYPHYTIVCRKK